MPLPCVISKSARQCHAKAKGTGEQCRNPAAYGMPVCRFHGARRPGTIKRGKDHPQYKTGKETLAAKAERSAKLTELRELETLSFELGLATGPRWRGRKPGRGKEH